MTRAAEMGLLVQPLDTPKNMACDNFESIIHLVIGIPPRRNDLADRERAGGIFGGYFDE
jgi:hypothetical protein